MLLSSNNAFGYLCDWVARKYKEEYLSFGTFAKNPENAETLVLRFSEKIRQVSYGAITPENV